jgi:AraC-like DNA-binding protein
MSKRTLQRRLTESGHNYSALVTRTRLRIAAEQLAETDMPVSEIAASLGYKDASNFTRAFRSQTGVAPSVYRKKVPWPIDLANPVEPETTDSHSK